MSTEQILIGLVGVLGIGTFAQWLAWRTKLPAILLLLLAGIAAGMSGLLDPNKLLGDGLSAIVSMSVAIILFEGGLSLRLSELRKIGKALSRLMTIGIVVTWTLSALFAYFFLDFSTNEKLSLSLLFGSILIVTGPTVIVPLMRQVRPAGNVASLLKWEGIVNDPIGVMFAVLVFEVILAGGLKSGSGVAVMSIINTIVYGTFIGGLGAGIMLYVLKRHLVPDFLQNPVTLAVVLAIFALSDHFQHESGLWAVTVMGIVLANQKMVRVKHIIEFKENLRVLLISALFILLAARLRVDDLAHINWGSMAFLAGLIFVVRPVAIFASTFSSNLSFNEKTFLSWMAPRGIVAASISAIFSFRLVELGYESARLLVPYTFIVIIGTVTIYGLSASFVANRLGVAKPDALGVLFLGAQDWVRDMARAIKELGFDVVVSDTNFDNIAKARSMGLEVFHGNILNANSPDELKLDGIGNFVAMTPNNEVNALACIRFEEYLDSAHVFQLPLPKTADEDAEHQMEGRCVFHRNLSFATIAKSYRKGGKVQKIEIDKNQSLDEFNANFENKIFALFHYNSSKELRVIADDKAINFEKGDTVICLEFQQSLFD